MNKLFAIALATTVVGGFAPLAAVGCTDEKTNGADSHLTAGACQVFSAAHKRVHTGEELAALRDPIAQKLLLGEGCPTNLDEITAKFERTDNKDCRSGSSFPGSSGF